MADKATQEETDLVAEFKELIEKQKQMNEEDEKVERLIHRKQKNPVANKVSFQEQNERMGIKNEVDLILNDIEKAEAQKKFDRDLIKFSQDIGVVKKEKEQKYQPVPPSTDPVPSYINQYRFIMTQYHQVSTSTNLYCFCLGTTDSCTVYHGSCFGVNFILQNFACVKEMTNMRYEADKRKRVHPINFAAT